MSHSLETNLKDHSNNNANPNSVYVGITALVGGACSVVVALVAIFSPKNLSAAAWMVGGLSAMGIALGYFSSTKLARKLF